MHFNQIIAAISVTALISIIRYKSMLMLFFLLRSWFYILNFFGRLEFLEISDDFPLICKLFILIVLSNLWSIKERWKNAFLRDNSLVSICPHTARYNGRKYGNTLTWLPLFFSRCSIERRSVRSLRRRKCYFASRSVFFFDRNIRQALSYTRGSDTCFVLISLLQTLSRR